MKINLSISFFFTITPNILRN